MSFFTLSSCLLFFICQGFANHPLTVKVSNSVSFFFNLSRVVSLLKGKLIGNPSILWLWRFWKVLIQLYSMKKKLQFLSSYFSQRRHHPLFFNTTKICKRRIILHKFLSWPTLSDNGKLSKFMLAGHSSWIFQ